MDSGPTAVTYKLIYFLRDLFNITLISLSKRDKISEEEYKKLGIKTYFFNTAEIYSRPRGKE